MSKFEIGDTVKIIVSNGGEANGFKLGVIGTIKSLNPSYRDYAIKIPDFDCSRQNNLYHADDRHLLLVRKKGKKMGRRTFRQLKESHTTKKGAIWQEECEDGTQPYELLDAGNYHKGGDRVNITERSLVEEQPQWFVEVFPATETYLTKDELTAFKAFLKKPAKKGKK